MVFSTDSDLSYIYLQYESEKVHGLFGLGWKNQGHTVSWIQKRKVNFYVAGIHKTDQNQLKKPSVIRVPTQ